MENMRRENNLQTKRNGNTPKESLHNMYPLLKIYTQQEKVKSVRNWGEVEGVNIPSDEKEEKTVEHRLVEGGIDMIKRI